MRKAFCISLENEIVEKIDDAKGRNEPRSRFIEYIISNYLEKNRLELRTTKPRGLTRVSNACQSKSTK
jgi:metal-responsive CopG/Arc/MetJ family transcriptional regulator